MDCHLGGGYDLPPMLRNCRDARGTHRHCQPPTRHAPAASTKGKSGQKGRTTRICKADATHEPAGRRG
eukprot:237810-Chlamydomonas_euryale.AAC.2